MRPFNLFNLFQSLALIMFIASGPLEAQDSDIPPTPRNAIDAVEAAQRQADRELFWDRVRTGLMAGGGALAVLGIPAYMLSIKNRDRADKQFQECIDQEFDKRDRDWRFRKLREYNLVKDAGFAREVNWAEIKKLDPPLRDLWFDCWARSKLVRSYFRRAPDHHENIKKKLDDYEFERTGAGERQRVGDGGFDTDGGMTNLPPPVPDSPPGNPAPAPGSGGSGGGDGNRGGGGGENTRSAGRPRTNPSGGGQSLAPVPDSGAPPSRSKHKKNSRKGGKSGSLNVQDPASGPNGNSVEPDVAPVRRPSSNSNATPQSIPKTPATSPERGQSANNGNSNNNKNKKPPPPSNGQNNGGSPSAKPPSDTQVGPGRRKRKGSGLSSQSTSANPNGQSGSQVRIPVTIIDNRATTGRRKQRSRKEGGGGGGAVDDEGSHHVLDVQKNIMPVGAGLMSQIEDSWNGVVQRGKPLINNVGGFMQELGQEVPRSMSRYFGGQSNGPAPGGMGPGFRLRPGR